jgi:hypothetical protein
MRNLTNETGVEVYVNSLDQGEATEVEQVSNTTQTKVNVSFKSNTTETTSLNDNDLVLIADNATGKTLKYITADNLKSHASEWTLNGSELYPDATATNVLVGTATNSGSHKFLVDGTAKITSDLTIDNIKNTNARDILNYSGTTLTIGNTTDNIILDGIPTINTQTIISNLYDTANTKQAIAFRAQSAGGTVSTIIADVSVKDAGGFGGNLILSTRPKVSNDGSMPTARMTILHDGNVGIGTITPSKKLHDINK